MDYDLSPVAKSVDEYLNAVNYSDIDNYVPSEFALNMVNLIKLIEGGDPENKSPVVHMRMLDNFVATGLDTLNMCHRGIAKSLSLDTIVLTDTGKETIGNLMVGQEIYGEDGKLTTVTHKSEIFNKPMYHLELSDGRSVDVSEDHINVVIQKRQKRIEGKRVNYYDRRELTTTELLKVKLNSTRKSTKKNPTGIENQVWIPTPKPMEFTKKNLPVDPYTIGLLLGDGCITQRIRFCGHVDDMVHYQKTVPYGFGKPYIKENTMVVGIKGIIKEIRALGMMKHGDFKTVPESYKFGSISQRLELLQGLMDTDGTVYKSGACSFTSNSKELVEDVMWLVRSLGGTASIGITGRAYRTHVSLNLPMFKLERKLERQRLFVKHKVALVSITRIEDCKSQCIAVDNQQRTFVCNDFIVTHNTTLKEYLMWYIAIFNELPDFGTVPYALYVSDSMDNGIKRMRKSIENRWHQSKFLQEYIPEIKLTDARWEFRNRDGKVFVVTGHGAKTGVRGTRENGSRPVLALLDDLLSDDDARSPTVINSIEETVYNAIEFALHPNRRKVIWSGTPFHASDPLYKAVESGAWAVNVYPVCETFPCTKEEFRGSWEDRFTYESLTKSYLKMKGLGKLDAFNQELMLRIMSDEDKVIEDADIQWFDRTSLLRVKDNYNFYITTDFATSEKTSADYSVISVWAYNNKGHWFWVDGVCKRQLMDKNLDDLFRMVQIYNPQSVGIEVSGQQGGFIPLIKREMLEKNIFFNFASQGNNNNPGIRPNTQKFTRFSTVLPWFKSRMMFFPEQLKDSKEMVECMNELGLVSRHGFKSKHDDFIDTISMLPLMSPWKPSDNTEFAYNDNSGVWEDVVEVDSYNYDSYIV